MLIKCWSETYYDCVCHNGIAKKTSLEVKGEIDSQQNRSLTGLV